MKKSLVALATISAITLGATSTFAAPVAPAKKATPTTTVTAPVVTVKKEAPKAKKAVKKAPNIKKKAR